VGAEAPERQLVGQLGELQGEGEVGVDGRNLPTVHSRPARTRDAGGVRRLLATTTVLLAALALASCGGGGSNGKAKRTPHRTRSTSTSSSSSSTSLPSTTSSRSAATTTTQATVTTTTTQPSGPTLPCDVQGPAITTAVENSAVGGINLQKGNFTVQECALARSDPGWARARLVPNPGQSFDGALVLVHLAGGTWTVQQVGSDDIGCGPEVPPAVRADFGFRCF
jgi:hypothetical protein